MKERLFQFMQGRYGVDQLNNVLIKEDKNKNLLFLLLTKTTIIL